MSEVHIKSSLVINTVSQLKSTPNTSVMDLGNLRSVSFTTLDEVLEIYASKPLPQMRNQVTKQLLTTQAKLLISQQAQKSLTEQLQSAEVMRKRLGLGSSNIANHPVVMKISALTTSQHLMRRYQLVLLRDMMRMKHALGLSVRPQLWENWYRNESDLQSEAPNVHNLFLWSLDVGEHDTNTEVLVPLNRFTLWRPNE